MNTTAEITLLSHDLLEGKVQMSIVFKNMSGVTIEQVDVSFKLKAGAQETEPQVKEHAIAMAKAILKKAHDGI